MPELRDDFLSAYFDIDTTDVGVAPAFDLLEEETEVPPVTADTQRDSFFSEYFDVKPEVTYVDTVQAEPETVLGGMINRTEWDEGLAKSIFYQYIMPGKNSTNQAAIKKNLLSWMGKKGKWERICW